MTKYVLLRKDVKDIANEYFSEFDFGQVMTLNLNNAKIFYSKEDAERFNKDYLHNEYDIKELEK